MANVFITGSSTGLGLMAARWLLERGHEVTVHARNEQRADDLSQALPTCPVVVGDLSSIADMRSVAEQVSLIGRHDAVIHNAGVYRMPHRVETADGLNLTFAVNVLAPYLLTALLERPDRLVYLSSGLSSGGLPGLDDVQWTRRSWDDVQSYSDSKLFDLMLAVGVARRWPDVRSNAVTPGWVPTRMGGPSASDDLALGAATQAWLAAGTDPATAVTGQFWFHQRAQLIPPATRRVAAQEELFAYCAQLTGTELPAGPDDSQSGDNPT
jgi:NAD(P)-dependent dehydrogenase (short-subunit alcohol dehydrogenase family)